MKKPLVFLLIPALLLAFLVTLSIQTPASAAPHRALVACSTAPSFANCDNIYPDADICPADAITIASSDIYNASHVKIGQVLVRYSPTCQSAWGKIDASPAAHLTLQLYRNGVYFAGANNNTTGTSIRTVMAYAAFQAMRACGTINGINGCTP